MSNRRFTLVVAILAIAVIAGLAVSNSRLTVVAAAAVIGLVALRIWRRVAANDPQLWAVTLVVGLVASGLFVIGLYGVSSDAPIALRIASCFIFVPAAYFAMLTWCFVYSAITSRRAPGADAMNRLFGRLNRNL